MIFATQRNSELLQRNSGHDYVTQRNFRPALRCVALFQALRWLAFVTETGGRVGDTGQTATSNVDCG